MPSVFHFLLLGLFVFRVQRLLTADDWPPSEWVRGKVEKRTGTDSAWTVFVNCGWCFSVWVAAATVLIDHYWGIPTVVLLIGAVAAFSGIVSDLVDD